MFVIEKKFVIEMAAGSLSLKLELVIEILAIPFAQGFWPDFETDGV